MAATQPFIIARVLLFSMHMLTELVHLCSSGVLRTSLRDHASHCAELLQRFFHGKSSCACVQSGATNAKLLQSHIDRVIIRRRLHYAQLCASMLCVPLSLLTFLGLVGALPASLDNLPEEYMVTIGYFMLVLVKIHSSIINVHNLDLWYSFFMGCVAFWHSPIAVVDKETFLGRTDDSIALLMGFLFSLMNLRARWYTFWTVVVISCHSYTTLIFKLDHTRIAEDLVVGFLLVTILRVLETTLRQDVTRELECKAGRGHRAALASLLRQLCNAVVEVDCKYRFVDDASDLSLLLLQPGKRSMEGWKLHDVFPDALDRHKLDQQLDKARGQATATLFKACLRDSSGEPVKVHVYIVGFQALDESMHFLIGLREYADESEMWSSSGGLFVIRESSNVDPKEDKTSRHRADVPAVPERKRESDTRSNSNDPQNPVHVEFAVGDNFPICAASSAFMQRYGKVYPGTSLTELIQFSPNFFSWVTDQKDRILQGDLETPRTEKFGNAFLTPVSQRRSTATCTRAGPQLLWVHFPNPSEMLYDAHSRDGYRVRLTVCPADETIPSQLGRSLDPDSSSDLDLECGGGRMRSSSSEPSSRSNLVQRKSPSKHQLAKVAMCERQMDRPMQVDFFVNDNFSICAMSTTFASAFGSGAAGDSLRVWFPFSSALFEWMIEHKRKVLMAESGCHSSCILQFGYACVVPIGHHRNDENQPGHRMVTVRFPDPRSETVNDAPMSETSFRASLCVAPLWLNDIDCHRQAL